MSYDKKVYLAGPITGLSYQEAIEWREKAVKDLSEHGIEGFSPMRFKKHLSDIREFQPNCEIYAALSALSSNRAIFTRDHFDATTCAVMVVNFLGATRISIGTCFELAWANEHRIPIVLIMEESGNPHDHAFVTEAAGFRVDNYEDGIDVVKAILIKG